MNIKTVSIITIKPRAPKCVCGKCENYMVVVGFERTGVDFNPSKLEWIPTFEELKVIGDMVREAYQHNLENDKFCYKKDSLQS